MSFFEKLPEQCPPSSAAESDFEPAYRVVTSKTPSKADFVSSATTRPCPDTVDPCRWASCSLFLSRSKAIEIARKLPKPRYSYPFFAALIVGKSDGLAIVNSKTSHVDFWMYASFDPVAAVVETESINGS